MAASAAAVRRSRASAAPSGKRLPLCFRYCSSSSPQEMKISEKNVDPKKVTSSKSKRARSIARLINTTPWSSELESSLSSLCTTPSNVTVLQTLQLIKTPSKAMSFFNWVQQKEGFSHNEHTYFKMLEILGKSRNLNAARNFLFSIGTRSGGGCRIKDKFFNSLIRSYGQADLFQESIKLFETMKSTGVSPSVITFNSLFSILLKRGRTNMVKSLYDEMLSTYGATPDRYTFNILIRGFCINAMVDDGFRFFKEMSRFNLDPDVITYNTLVDGLCRVGKVKIASNVVKGMVKKNADLNPNIVTYTTLIRGFCKKGDIDEALSALQEIIDRGLKPNEITYNTLIRGLCEVKKFDKIKEILDGTNDGFIPDTCTFNTLIHTHCSSGNLEAAMEGFSRMQKLQVSPDSATYSVLIRSLCQNRKFDKAEDFLNELLEKEILISQSGCMPLTSSYNPIFHYLCGTGKTMKAEKLLRQLMKRGVQDPSSYTTVITGHCKEGTFETGYEILVLMLRKSFEPDLETYISLIDGLLAKGNPVLALRTLEKTLISSHRPRTSTFHLLLSELLKQEFAEESMDLVTLMLEKDVRPNRDLSTDTLKLVFKRGLKRKAFEFVKSLYQKGFVVEMEGVVDFLCRNRRFLEGYELAVFGLEKDEKFSGELCDCVLRGLCGKKRVLEAFGLFYELVERGSYGELSCLEELRDALLSQGKNVEAEFVAKRMMPSTLQT